jgi:WD40-like Beta Propeller Repeat
MRLVAIVARVMVDTAGLFSPRPLAKGAERMAKTNHFGALAAAAGTLVAVGLVVLIMMVVEARPAEATFPGNNGRIAFVGQGVLDSHIFTIDPDGSGLDKISTRPFYDSDPAWSPDGKKIAYAIYDGHDSEISTINAIGGTPVQVTYDHTDAWGPDWGSRP